MTALEFNHQVASLQEVLHLFTYRFTKNHEESEDLVQDTILKALKYREKFKENTNLKGWLFTIMRNTYINGYRKNKKANTWLDDTPNLHKLNVEETYTFNKPGKNLEYNEILEKSKEIESFLWEPFKMYTDGYKYQEIADHFNLPLGTVKNRIFHARKEMQEKLKDYAN
jgi:RNA polymerase sigma-70 factor (ECF subfamily)